MTNIVFEPVQQAEWAGSETDRRIGASLIAQGKVACLILAGGQGSRLGVQGPKGAVIVSGQKSLFQIFSEKILHQSQQSQSPLYLAIMTSPLNHHQTVAFFEAHHHFGLPDPYLDFFEQKMLPLSDIQGNEILEESGKIMEAPNGNGEAFHLLYRTGIFEKWRIAGVEYVNVILVDNCLAEPFDPELIGYQVRTHHDVVIKAVCRTSADEKMGIVIQDQGRIRIAEYSEIPKEVFEAINPDGSLRLSIASTGLFSFHMNFIERIVKDPHCQLPLHKADKQIIVDQRRIPVYKYETFLFDLLIYTKAVGVLLYPRSEIYAPLKTSLDLEKIRNLKIG